MNKNNKETYSEEFKTSSVKLALKSEQSHAQTARELGIKASTLYTWIDKSRPARNGSNPAYQEELKQLRSEVSKLKTERDILKKAAAYFAIHTK